MRGEESHMTDSEQLVQRFLDQELSADERVRFVVRLGRDAMLRGRVLELEQLLLDVSRLPRPAVPEEFVARVMDGTASTALGSSQPGQWRLSRLLRRLAEPLWAPREFQWNLAGAIACLALLVVGGVVAGRLTGGPSPALPTSTSGH